jgi:hypothetical protein
VMEEPLPMLMVNRVVLNIQGAIILPKAVDSVATLMQKAIIMILIRTGFRS